MRTLARLRRASGDCLVRYTVQKFAGANGDIRAIVRVYAVTHSHATNGTCRHLAPWCREFIRMEYIARDAPTAYEIEKAVRSEALTRGVAYAKERAAVLEPDLTEAELRRRWLNDSTQKGQFVREFFITTKMVRDMLAAVERDSSQLMPEEAASIEAWVNSHPEDTLMYRPGVVTPAGAEEVVRAQTASVVQALAWSKPYVRTL